MLFDKIHRKMFHNTHRSIKHTHIKIYGIPMQKGVLEVVRFVIQDYYVKQFVMYFSKYVLAHPTPKTIIKSTSGFLDMLYFYKKMRSKSEKVYFFFHHR